MRSVLITGGAGFIGSELVKVLHSAGCQIFVLDSLTEQVHGADPKETSATFAKISGLCEFIHADVRDREALKKVLPQVDTVVHLAAETGTGQSMYAISNYCDVNVQGTAVLLEESLRLGDKIKKIVVASSRAIYGEGKYQTSEGVVFYPEYRKAEDMARGIFEPIHSQSGKVGQVVATSEDAPAKPQSIYGITKLTQEELVLKAAASAGIPAVALRFQNVYGPGQSLSNPYTGILSIFSTRARNNSSINIFEDGLESRDFVFITDVVESLRLAIFSSFKGQVALNVGSGISTSVNEVVNTILAYFKSTSQVTVTGEFRIGDIRHNYADLTKAKSILNFSPTVGFAEGCRAFLEWASGQSLVKDEYEKSLKELKDRGLLKKND